MSKLQKFKKFYSLYKNDKINNFDIKVLSGLNPCEIKKYINESEVSRKNNK
jgi:hypothetical protein